VGYRPALLALVGVTVLGSLFFLGARRPVPRTGA
jgi:hypothetical protein